MEEDIMILESECYYLKELGYLKENNHFIRFNQALENLIKDYKEKEEIVEQLDKQMFKFSNEVVKDCILKSKIREFFTSRLEKYQEADDGAYEQDYLTRGELELVDRYKECKEIAKILLEEEIKAEIPQDYIPKSKIKEKIEELDKKEKEELKGLKGQNIYFVKQIYMYKRNILQ